MPKLFPIPKWRINPLIKHFFPRKCLLLCCRTVAMLRMHTALLTLLLVAILAGELVAADEVDLGRRFLRCQRNVCNDHKRYDVCMYRCCRRNRGDDWWSLGDVIGNTGQVWSMLKTSLSLLRQDSSVKIIKIIMYGCFRNIDKHRCMKQSLLNEGWIYIFLVIVVSRNVSQLH